MTFKQLTAPLAMISSLAAAFLAGVALIRTPQAHADPGNSDDSRIQIGFAIAPVPLNLTGKNRSLVGLGSYIVNAQADCNGCHQGNPMQEYASGGNPQLLSPPYSGTVKINPATYLAGGRDFGPYANLTHLYSRNLTPDVTGLPEGGHSLSDFIQIMRTGIDFDHIHPSCPAPFNCIVSPFNGSVLQIMPWPEFGRMTDHDLEAIWTYLSAIPCNPGPSGLDSRLYQQNVCPTN
jgi:hypothetical protein